MSTQTKRDKLHAFYSDLCISLVGSLRALSLYPPDHPETKKMVGNIFQRLSKYLNQRPSLTLLIVSGDIVVENTPLPELNKTLGQFIKQMDSMNFQHIQFKNGLSSNEFVLFLQLLLRSMKKPSSAVEIMAKNQGRLSHILVSTLPEDNGPQLAHEEFSGALQAAHQSIVSFSGKLKDLLTDLEGPLLGTQVSEAKETSETIYRMSTGGEIPLEILIYRRSTDADPYIHAIHVCSFSMFLSQEIELEESIIQEIGLAALLHDTGLYLTPSVPLSETSATTLDERKRQWEHPVRGAEILLATPGLPDLVPIVAYEHHLHYDGGGYPEQKRHRDLNLASMITGITDSYDNLRRNRPGQDALSLIDTIDWMDRMFGTQFHPLLFKKFRALVKSHAKEQHLRWEPPL